MGDVIEIRRYLTESGRDVFGDWLGVLKDIRTRARVLARVDRLATGNFGDCKYLGSGLYELRLDFGPGYRVYYALVGRTCALLLCSGDKRTQAADIRRARTYLEDYRERSDET